MKDWRTTIGGAISSLGTTLFGANTVLAVTEAVPKKLVIGLMITGFIMSAIGKFFASLFTPDKQTVDEKVQKAVDETTFTPKPHAGIDLK